MKKMALAFRVLVFMIILTGALYMIRLVMMRKNEEELSSFYFHKQKYSNDVVFLGPSTSMGGIYPLQLWEEEGIVSYNLCSGAQTIAMSYCLADEVIKKDKPQLIVLDCGRAFLDEKVSADVYLHYLTDKMPLLSLARYKLLRECSDEINISEFLFPLEVYHERWKEGLGIDEFTTDSKAYTNGAKVEANHFEKEAYDLNQINTDDAIGYTSRVYIDKIVNLCKETGTELLLLMVPFPGRRPDIPQEEYDRRRNAAYALEEYASEKGIICCNLFDKSDEIGISRRTDTIDGEHMCFMGAEKLTRYIGQFISSQYTLEDKRGETEYSGMDQAAEKFNEYKEIKIIQTSWYYPDYFKHLIKMAEEKDYLIILSSQETIGDYLAGDLGQYLHELGLKTEWTSDMEGPFIGVIDNRAIYYEDLGDDEQVSLTFDGTIGNYQVHADSSIITGAYSSIRINHTEYSMKGKGLNLVVFDKETGKLVDSCLVDTYNAALSMHRNET